ncbi:MAG: hypothetical protein NTY19_05715 [Planctomycetota bacterium]|nr:hypothetical protein [Planctomycetota bacterium]
MIGALAAVGLSAQANDGRLVQIGSWPDDLTGPQHIATLAARDVEVRHFDTQVPIRHGLVDVGKHLRPNLRAGRAVLFVTPTVGPLAAVSAWTAVRLK